VNRRFTRLPGYARLGSSKNPSICLLGVGQRTRRRQTDESENRRDREREREREREKDTCAMIFRGFTCIDVRAHTPRRSRRADTRDTFYFLPHAREKVDFSGIRPAELLSSFPRLAEEGPDPWSDRRAPSISRNTVTPPRSLSSSTFTKAISRICESVDPSRLDRPYSPKSRLPG
jgi:hypothetical protein